MTTDEMYQRLRERFKSIPDLQLPPPCFNEMQPELLDYVEGQELTMRFPVLPRYQNPLGYMQGGFIVAALDNTVGPFSYLIAPPSVTSQLNVQYLRPITAKMAAIIVTARLTQRTSKMLYLSGEVLGEDGRALAMCQSVAHIV